MDDKVNDKYPRDTPDDRPPEPRLTRNMDKVPVSLKLMSPDKQSEGTSKPEKDKTVVEHRKKECITTIQTTTTSDAVHNCTCRCAVNSLH